MSLTHWLDDLFRGRRFQKKAPRPRSRSGSLTRPSIAEVLEVRTLLSAAPSITNGVVFSTDFESGIPAEMTGPGVIEDSQGFNTGDFLHNTSFPSAATVLTLTDLPEHDSVSLDFLLAIINSWDGATGGASPDFFNVTIDGVTIFSEAFDNIDGNEADQTYVPPAGVLLTPRPLTSVFGPSTSRDALYAMGLDPIFDAIPHTADTLTVEWFANGAGYQGGVNESWAIDEVHVTLGGLHVDGAENQTTVIDVNATDPDGETENGGGLTYSVTGGADQALFSIDADTGVLRFNVAPDFEAPADANADNVYDVEVTVTDAGLLTGTQTFAVNVTDVNDVLIIDDGDAGFAIEKGSWGTGNAGEGGDNRNASIFGGTKVARWAFTDLTPGQYRISATWKPAPGRATDAPYTIIDGSTVLTTVDVNQQQSPTSSAAPTGLQLGLPDSGVQWRDLGGLVTITSDRLFVKLTNVANGYVMADSIRIERVGDTPSPSLIQVIDDSDPGFTIESGTWGTGNAGVNDTNRNASTFGGTKVARWTFSDLVPGQYRVAATWTSHASRATDAPFTVFDGSTLVGTIDVNQQLSPDDFLDAGIDWEELITVNVTGDTLVVKLSNAANGYVTADAIRIERIGDLPSGP